MSPDLRNATAYVVPLGGGDPETLLAGLGRAAAYLGRETARIAGLRFAPRLVFVADSSFDEARRITEALKAPQVARDLGAPDGDDDGR